MIRLDAHEIMWGEPPGSALRSLADDLSSLEDWFGGHFQPMSNPSQICRILLQHGNGARGLVAGDSLILGRKGHVFNVVNIDGNLRFLDGEAGNSGFDYFNTLKNFQLLMTNPCSL
jgi:filamentous hemagglutinin